MLTGVEDVTTPVKAFRLGAIDYLQKPFQAEELRTAIDYGIASREAEPAFRGSGNPHFDRGKFYWAGWRLTAARRR
jgi:FixJ family two-component response regulator